jgi:hypothetical protein
MYKKQSEASQSPGSNDSQRTAQDTKQKEGEVVDAEFEDVN